MGVLATGFAAVLTAAPAAAAATLHTLYDFDDVGSTKPAGGGPLGNIVLAADGTLFGTTPENLQPDLGTVYLLKPPATGATRWTHAVVWYFNTPGLGVDPEGGLTPGPNGELYGTTPYNTGNAFGCGQVFRLSFTNGAIQRTTLYRFGAPPLLDACIPYDPVSVGADGSLYGTTSSSPSFYGAIFQLVAPASGNAPWTEHIIYEFQGQADGYYPSTPVLVSRTGELYGTSIGSANDGPAMQPLYQLRPPAQPGQPWTFTLIWQFQDLECGQIAGGMIEDAAGAILFTCVQGENGGPNQYGSVYRLVPPAPASSGWTLETLWTFTNGADGAYPTTGLVADPHGNLYGTTAGGNGGVFKLSPPAAGGTAWTETTLWSFNGKDGMEPATQLVRDSKGVLYGTTRYGGPFDNGTVFALTP